MRIGPLEVCEDVAPAGWVQQRLGPFAQRVTSIVPAGFPAYARVFHPAWRTHAVPGGFAREPSPVRWADVARAEGRVVHPLMQFPGISGVDPLRSASPRPELWDTVPDLGNLPERLAARLVAVLRGHTSTPERCWFAVWAGWAGFAPRASGAPTFSTPGRDYYLLRGPIEGALQTMAAAHVAGDASVTLLYRRPSVGQRLRRALARSLRAATRPGRHAPPAPDAPGHARDVASLATWQSVNLWWPEDRAWCVATEIDFLSTYVGGSEEAVAGVMADEYLEAMPVQPGDGITEDSDRRNPPPEGAA